jgi:hypothetical protein
LPGITFLKKWYSCCKTQILQVCFLQILPRATSPYKVDSFLFLNYN